MRSELEAILRHAGSMVLAYDDPKVTVKDGHANFVTEADVAVQDYVLEALAKQYPGASFLAEEQAEHHMGEGLTFLVDPIDGTTNFMRGRRSSVICIGAVERGQVVFSGIYNPYEDELYHAVRGQGAWCNETRLHVSDEPPERALIALGSTPYDVEFADLTGRTVSAILRDMGDVRRSGSAALDLCSIAAGRCEGTFEWNLRPWDFCAGSLLVEEAGGRCSHILGGEMTFAEAIPFMCASARCYDALQALLLRVHAG